MPGDPHEIISNAIQNEPKSAAWLLDLADRSDLAAHCSEAETRSNSVGSPGLTERRADVVIRLAFPDEPDRIVICEVQNKWKNEKYYRLPGYVARAFEDYQVSVELVLICPSDSVAARYAEGIRLSADSFIAVHALGPSDFPALTASSPPPSAAAALITAVVGKPPPESEVEEFVSTLDRSLGTMEPGRAADCVIYLMSTMPVEIAALLEELMQTKTRTYHSAYSDRLRAEGREEGYEKGYADATVKQTRSILVSLIEAKPAGITLEQRSRIEACSSLQQLNAWIMKFSESGSVSELFDE
jgi:hypothetical protein